MDDVAKYELELEKRDDKYSDCRIGGLKMAYYKDHNGNLESFGGAVGLLKNEDYKGYCNLCMTYHSFNDDKVGDNNLPGPVYVVEFSPLYNEYGQLILVKYDRDEIFATIDRGGYKDYYDAEDFSKYRVADAELTLWRNGAFTEFKK